jgi:NAD(P)H-dependent flavin oxidoreductase YrpB (nitropropane dioxygenase family)
LFVLLQETLVDFPSLVSTTDLHRKSYDYTKGKLNELITIIIESGTKLFVCAIGVPPKPIVDRLHKGGVLYMNMIGHPKHVQKCLANDVDILCAQGGEAGGHTGDVPTSVLIPAVAKLVKGKKSTFTGKDVQVVAAGGISNGETVAAALMMGASAVWVGTRFILADESGASKVHQEEVLRAGFDDTVRTIIFSVRFFHIHEPFVFLSKTVSCRDCSLLTNKQTGPPPPSPQNTLHPQLGREPPRGAERANGERRTPSRPRRQDPRSR